MATLKCFPKSEKLTRAKEDRPLNERVRRPKSRATEEKNRSHVWKWMYNKWGCVKCLTVTDCWGEDDEPPCWEPCQPGHVASDMERALRCGHSLMVSQVVSQSDSKVSTKPLLWCKNCGAWAQAMFMTLSKPCQPCLLIAPGQGRVKQGKAARRSCCIRSLSAKLGGRPDGLQLQPTVPGRRWSRWACRCW